MFVLEDKEDMNEKQTIDIDIQYVGTPDTETPFIRCVAVPRVGEIIIADSRKKYSVVQVQYDCTHPAVRDGVCKIVVVVEPYVDK
jgi:hypothetical protein